MAARCTVPAAASRERVLAGEAATAALGAALALAGLRRGAVHLAGDLGSGKTTLVRGFLRASGVTGPIRSPTFTMVEEYRVGSLLFAHYDLYRVADPEELEYLGLRDHLAAESLLFVEWPERGAGLLPRPTLAIRLEHLEWKPGTGADDSRRVRCAAFGPEGNRVLDRAMGER